MIRAVSILLILWGCAFAQAPIEITSSTPLGMPCGGISTLSTLGCMPDAQCGWMVVVKTGDAAAFAGKLTYADAEGKEQTATATAASTGEYTALPFRVGVFRPSVGNRFVSVEVSALKASATVRQDADGAIITVGATTWGPPKHAEVRLAGESLRVTSRISGLTTIVTRGDPAQATTNLKEWEPKRAQLTVPQFKEAKQ